MEKEEPVTAPIKDTNGNKQLDSKELIDQLKAENEKGGEHTAKERVQGVLEHLGLREKLDDFNAKTKSGSISTNKDMIDFFENMAKELTTELKEGVNGAKLLQRDPEYRKKMEGFLAEQAAQEGGDPKAAAVKLADFNNFLDFAQTFDDTFKSIKMEWVDMPKLLSQFGKLDLPKATTEKKGQDR